MRVLAFETSCDETGVAIYDAERGLLANELFSQVELHAAYGGVVPELASRDHVRKLVPLLKQALSKSDCKPTDFSGVAYTAGPGLVGALLTGAAFARSLAWAWQVPSVAIHHLEAHVLAVMLEDNTPAFPFIALLVSGGHTLLVKVNGLGDYQQLGETLDDAAGEAFDKVAKLLGLPYPGGPHLATLAEQGEAGRYQFPRPMLERPGLDFSFSGLKTHALQTWRASSQDEQAAADIALAFQEAVVDVLAGKSKRALAQTECQHLVLAGGVAANKALRAQLQQLAEDNTWHVFYPRPAFCTDNAAMVAYAGYCRLQRGQTNGLSFQVYPRWPLTES